MSDHAYSEWIDIVEVAICPACGEPINICQCDQRPDYLDDECEEADDER